MTVIVAEYPRVSVFTSLRLPTFWTRPAPHCRHDDGVAASGSECLPHDASDVARHFVERPIRLRPVNGHTIELEV